MKVSDDKLREFALNNPNLVSMHPSTRYPELNVVKYKRKVFYDNLWTPELCEMRGLVVDKNWTAVARPFTKVFNYQENGTTFPLDEQVTSVQKINGFMAGITWTGLYGPNDPVISTTGSLDSPFVELARKNMERLIHEYKTYMPNITYLFEVVDPTDPHIIEEKAGLYLIGARMVDTGTMYSQYSLDKIADRMEVFRPSWKETTFKQVLDEVRICKHEGFMVYDWKDNALKIKSPHYLIKKFFSRVRAEKLTAKWLADNKQNFDEEFYGLIDYIIEHNAFFTTMDQEGRKAFIEGYLNE